MRERADGNEINAGRGNLADRFERHATARLKHRRGPLAAHRDRFTQIVEAHVVEQDVVDAIEREKLTHLIEAIGLKLDFDAGLVVFQLPDRRLNCRDATFGDEVVVLHHRAVMQVHAMVVTAAVEHRFFFKQSVAWSCFARVEDARASALDRIDITRSERGNTAEPLRKIESRAFPAEDRTRRSLDAQQQGSFTHAAAIFDQDFDRQRGVDLFKNTRGELDAGDHTFAARRDEGPRAAIGRDEILRSDIAIAEVFSEREIDQCFRVVFQRKRNGTPRASAVNHASPPMLLQQLATTRGLPRAGLQKVVGKLRPQ